MRRRDAMSIPNNPGEAASYAKRVTAQVPALADLHRMTGILLAEHVPDKGRVIVLGAGGGLELRALATQYPDWQFDGIDPSPSMLAQAVQTLGPHAEKVILHQGYIDTAPTGPFDGAVCLLTLHFLPRDERLQTLRELVSRLRPGAPLVVAHHSFPKEHGQDDIWLRRNAALGASGNTSKAHAEQGIRTMKERLPALSPEEDEQVLREAGFDDIRLFFAAFTFKGWVSRRSG